MNGNNFTYTNTNANMDNTMSAHMSMKQALMDQGDDVPDFAHSARQSVSSYGRDSPSTPHTAQDEMDFKMPANGETPYRIASGPCYDFFTYNEPDMRPVPKLERTFTDIAADTGFYEPSSSQPALPSKPAQSSLLSPYRSNANENVQRALQAAQYARSQSPSSTASRSDSPFRKSSPYRPASNSFTSPMGTAVAAREQNRQADAAYAMKSQIQTSDDGELKTISPKDALLDYRESDEDSKVPLFPDNGASEYDGQYNSGEQYRNATQTNFDTTSSQQSYRRDSWATPQFSPNFSTTTAPPLQQTSSFNFATPSSIQNNINGLPLTATSQYRSTPNTMSSTVDQTPEFPAHLTSMESSASEAEPPNGSQNSVLSDRYLTKPASSAADSGTYSCTYHGCSQRFETPQKLQKHKRDGHRNTNLSAAMTSAAILERNSQAGPHKCERINPTTGKPCSTVFSRPYDLTRHEDTIHNGRKQKVRCALCVEEKTFSRNDALTRHMRVVHPEVDFPGKHRRRGGHDWAHSDDAELTDSRGALSPAAMMIRTFHNNRGPSTACTAAFQDATHDDENTSSAALFPHPLHSRWAVTADLGLSGVASYPVVAGRTGSHGVSDLFLSLVYCFFQSLFCVRDAICALAFSAIDERVYGTMISRKRWFLYVLQKAANF
jgi:hypothetical protein